MSVGPGSGESLGSSTAIKIEVQTFLVDAIFYPGAAACFSLASWRFGATHGSLSRVLCFPGTKEK